MHEHERGLLIEGQDDISYRLEFSPFRLVQMVDGEETVIVNDSDDLYYDAKNLHAGEHHSRQHHSNGLGEDELIQGYSVGLDFTFASNHLYGIPERATKMLLEKTGYENPYRLFDQDLFPHSFGDPSPLYGSVPYIMGHNELNDASVAWMNSAETFVFINDSHHAGHLSTAFLSQGNTLEFYLLGSRESPKNLQKKLSELTGYPPMPPLHSLGYHFSKWENNTAEMIMDRNEDFSKHNYPVDVFWFDIEFSQNKGYFEFDRLRFPQNKMMQMNEQVEKKDRRFVVINDPHVYADQSYFVYKEGIAMDGKKTKTGETMSPFIKDPLAGKPWIGKCWPGESVWYDFLNTNTQDYYESLFHPSVYRGTNYMYGIWNDMNEPSVFKGTEEIEQLGMPMNNTHTMADGSILQHRWVHNAYGALH